MRPKSVECHINPSPEAKGERHQYVCLCQSLDPLGQDAASLSDIPEDNITAPPGAGGTHSFALVTRCIDGWVGLASVHHAAHRFRHLTSCSCVCRTDVAAGASFFLVAPVGAEQYQQLRLFDRPRKKSSGACLSCDRFASSQTTKCVI